MLLRRVSFRTLPYSTSFLFHQLTFHRVACLVPISKTTGVSANMPVIMPRQKVICHLAGRTERTRAINDDLLVWSERFQQFLVRVNVDLGRNVFALKGKVAKRIHQLEVVASIQFRLQFFTLNQFHWHPLGS